MLRLYNTLTRKLEPFKPLHKSEVRIYACGPTVYDYAHVGNFRAFVYEDLLHRYLRFLGYTVTFVQNITDVGHLTEQDIAEDRMVVAARREHKSPQAIADFYTDAFRRDRKALHILPPTHEPRATAYIGEMIAFIEQLIKKGFAYEKNGSVFFSVRAFEPYGKLSRNSLVQIKKGARLEAHPDKRDQLDFALWLAAPKGHLMQWDSPWGKGYPGWHIECSVMSIGLLGPSFDIHMGGEDHIFPHHENEIAQSEAYTAKPFARFWIHVRHLLVGDVKISKSLRNFVTLADIAKEHSSPLALRAFYFLAHYRRQVNFSLEALAGAHEIRERIQSAYASLAHPAAKNTNVPHLAEKLRAAERRITAAMDNDLHAPKALAAYLSFLKYINPYIARARIGPKDTRTLRAWMEKIDGIFGLLTRESAPVPPPVLALVRLREGYRQKKNWKEADRIRKEIEQKGFEVEDRATGPILKRKTRG